MIITFSNMLKLHSYADELYVKLRILIANFYNLECGHSSSTIKLYKMQRK